MKKFTTLGGSLFLIWLLFSPVLALGLFSHYYDSLLGHGINLLSFLVLSYLFFGFVGALLMRALHQKFLVSDAAMTPRALVFGIVAVANMFGAALEVVLKDSLFANPFLGFVAYPGAFFIASTLFVWIWDRSIRATVICTTLSLGFFAAIVIPEYFHVPRMWVLLCLALITALFPTTPRILTTNADATSVPNSH